MTALEIIEAVRQAGGSIEAVGPDRVRVLAPNSVLGNVLKAAVVERKPELLTFLRHETGYTQRLLREGRWPPTLPVCEFLIGHSGERCRRCGATWPEHCSSGTR